VTGRWRIYAIGDVHGQQIELHRVGERVAYDGVDQVHAGRAQGASRLGTIRWRLGALQTRVEVR
jgi:hypothetical protein